MGDGFLLAAGLLFDSTEIDLIGRLTLVIDGLLATTPSETVTFDSRATESIAGVLQFCK